MPLMANVDFLGELVFLANEIVQHHSDELARQNQPISAIEHEKLNQVVAAMKSLQQIYVREYQHSPLHRHPFTEEKQ